MPPLASLVVRAFAAARRGRESEPARWGLLIVLLLYLALGTAYSLLTPLGEAPDELDHFLYMRHIVEERRLPRTAEERLAIGVKGHEPPLYHAALGLATAWVDTRPLPQIKMLDPERWPRHSLPDEVLIDFSPLHTADELWPFRGVVLVWHLARLLSLGLMAATLAVLFRVVRLVIPKQPGVALLAVTAVGLTPQFVYIGGSLNNDALAALLGALAAWLLVRVAQGDARWRQFLLLGLVLGLARLTKFYALAFLPVAVLVLLVVAWRRREPRYACGLLPALALSFAIPAPWLFYIQPADPALLQGWGRLWALFDAVHIERWFSTGGEGQAGSGALAVVRALLSVVRQQPLAWALTLFKSFWGYFGAMTLQAPPLLYAVAAGLGGLSLLGWGRVAWQRLRRRPSVVDGAQGLCIPILLALAFLAVEAAFYGVMKRLPDTAQGRHLYPGLAGLALILVVGWWGLWRPLASRWATAGLAVLLTGLSLYCLPTARGVPAPLPPVRSAPWPDMPAGAEALPLGDGLVMEGARWSAGTPGRVEGVLFWRADRPPTSETVIVLELLDQAGAVQAVWAGHPGGPRYPTQAWDAGDHVRQTLSWPLPGPLSTREPSLRLRALREGVQTASLDLPFIALPAVPASASCTAALQTVALRDTLLLTAPGGRIQDLSGPHGALWQPLARTARGDQAAFVVDAHVRPGAYVLAGEGSQAASALQVTVEGRERTFEPPPGLQPVGAILGDGVELLGYALEGGSATRVAPGDTVRLRLAWRARGRIDRHYTVFTHLVDSAGHMVGQEDKLPGHGYSTLFWAPGEVVVDEYRLQVDPAAPAGDYHLEVGLYQALSGVRAPAQGGDGGDHVALGTVQVAR